MQFIIKYNFVLLLGAAKFHSTILMLITMHALPCPPKSYSTYSQNFLHPQRLTTLLGKDLKL